MRGADILYIEAMQVCAELIYCISGHASLRGADLLYIGAMQVCAELIYCISRPQKPTADGNNVFPKAVYGQILDVPLKHLLLLRR